MTVFKEIHVKLFFPSFPENCHNKNTKYLQLIYATVLVPEKNL